MALLLIGLELQSWRIKMRKLAFRNKEEQKLLISCFAKHMPQYADAFAKFAAKIAIGGNVEEHADQLRNVLDSFLGELKGPDGSPLNHDPNALLQIENVIRSMQPLLSQATPVTEHPIWQQDTPWTMPGQSEIGVNVGSAEDISVPDLEMPRMRISPSSSTDKKEVSAEYDKLLSSMVELADMADEAGLTIEADRIATAFPFVHTLKTAQYEGFNNYWIANGRAFEMAYKQKRIKGDDPDKFRSANEVWWEVLEEFQDGLLGNQHDFIGKYANKQTTLNDKTANLILSNSIADRMEEGSDPGVAFYEAIEDLADGKHTAAVERTVITALSELSKKAKEEGKTEIAEKAEALIKEADWGGAKKWVKKKLGLISQPEELQDKIETALPRASATLNQATISGISMVQLTRNLAPLLRPLYQFYLLWKRTGRYAPDFPNLYSYGVKGVVDQEHAKQLEKDLNAVLEIAQDPQDARVLSEELQEQIIPWAGKAQETKPEEVKPEVNPLEPKTPLAPAIPDVKALIKEYETTPDSPVKQEKLNQILGLFTEFSKEADSMLRVELAILFK